MAGNGSRAGNSRRGGGVMSATTKRLAIKRRARIQEIRTNAMRAASVAANRAGVTGGAGKTARQLNAMAKRRAALPEVQRNAAIARIGRGDTQSDFLRRGNGNRARRRVPG